MKRLIENWRKHLKEQQSVSYSGIVLDEESRQKLLSLPIPKDWEPIAHHMTITMGPLKDSLAEIYKVGDVMSLTVIALGQDEKAMAVKVKSPGEISDHISFPHITVAIDRVAGGKPLHSNKIPEEKFKPYENIILSGVVTEVIQ
jgi:hypothetical protein